MRHEVTPADTALAVGSGDVEVRAINSAGQLIADGELERVVVDRERFLAGVP